MNRLFDDTSRGAAAAGAAGQGALMAPSIDVSETNNELRITAEIPGVGEDDVDVTLRDDMLVIRGQKKSERKEDRENVHVSECSYGTFERALRLPYAIDADQVQARFRNGVLTVTLPKTEQQQRARRIQIQSGGQQASQARASPTTSSTSNPAAAAKLLAGTAAPGRPADSLQPMAGRRPRPGLSPAPEHASPLVQACSPGLARGEPWTPKADPSF